MANLLPFWAFAFLAALLVWLEIFIRHAREALIAACSLIVSSIVVLHLAREQVLDSPV